MSHFSVLVFGPENEQELEEALEPFYEQGEDSDDFMEFTDCTDEVMDKWDHGNGLYPLHDNSEHDLKVTMLEKYNNLENFVSEWFGYSEVDGQYGYYNNPNAKWDWWTIGGRWSGFFKHKNPTVGEKQEGAWNRPPVEQGYVDVIQIKDIDFDGMMRETRDHVGKAFDAYEKAKGNTTPVAWKEYMDGVGTLYPTIDDARDAYHATPYYKAMEGVQVGIFTDAYTQYCEAAEDPREAMIQDAVNGAITPFACLKDDEWRERGEMGWFGMCSNEKEADNWDCEFHEVLASMDPETWVINVDCHI